MDNKIGVMMKQQLNKNGSKESSKHRASTHAMLSPIRMRDAKKELNYYDLNTKLQYPNNPAYFTMKKIEMPSGSDNNQQKQTGDFNDENG